MNETHPITKNIIQIIIEYEYNIRFALSACEKNFILFPLVID